MMFLFLLLILAATAAGIWFQGFWNAVVILVNLILAMAIATNFYEPAQAKANSQQNSSSDLEAQIMVFPSDCPSGSALPLLRSAGTGTPADALPTLD